MIIYEQFGAEPDKEGLILERIELAIKLERIESFPFPGISAESYERLKTDEEEMPGFCTPIDELITRFEKEGVKVVITGVTIQILPRNSDNILEDSVLPRNLEIVDGMDPDLRRLIELDRL